MGTGDYLELIDRKGLRKLVGLLMILPELERSADLAEYAAQRAVDELRVAMSPMSRAASSERPSWRSTCADGGWVVVGLPAQLPNHGEPRSTPFPRYCVRSPALLWPQASRWDPPVLPVARPARLRALHPLGV